MEANALVGVSWYGGRLGRFLVKFHDSEIFVHTQDSETAGFFDRNVDRADDDIGVLSDEPMKHLHIVHLIDVIAGKNQHDIPAGRYRGETDSDTPRLRCPGTILH